MDHIRDKASILSGWSPDRGCKQKSNDFPVSSIEDFNASSWTLQWFDDFSKYPLSWFGRVVKISVIRPNGFRRWIVIHQFVLAETYCNLAR